jgi:hypothetical protein
MIHVNTSAFNPVAYKLSAFGDVIVLRKKCFKKSTVSFGSNYINTSTIYCFARGNRSHLMYSQPPRKAVAIC